MLKRQLNFKSAFYFVTGSIIGSGVFLVASDVTRALPSPVHGLLAWVVAGLVTFISGLIFAELGGVLPHAGGQYVYLREAFGPVVAFSYGWTNSFVIQPGTLAALAVASVRFFVGAFPSESFVVHLDQKFLAVVGVIAFTVMNFSGIKKVATFLNAITFVKILVLVLIAAIGIFGTSGSSFFAASAPSLTQPFSWSAFGVAMIAAFWAYDGAYNLGYIAGEIENPKKNVPLSLVFGVLAVVVLYVLVNLAYYRTLSPQQISESTLVAADSFRLLLGTKTTVIVSLLVLLSTVGCLNTQITGGARVLFAMAEDKCLPRKLAAVNERSHSPNAALFVQMVWSLALIWSGSYDQLFTFVIFGAFLYYALCALALIKLRWKNKDSARPYSMPLYPWLPIVYVLFTAAFMINSIIEKPKESLVGLALIISGLPVYYAMKYFQRNRCECSC